MRRRLRRLSAAAASAADPAPPKRSRSRGRYDRCGSGPAVAASGCGEQAASAAHLAGPFTGGFAVASLISTMANGPSSKGVSSVLRVEGWLNVWAINGVQKLYLFDDGAVPAAAWQPRFCVLIISEQMIDHHCSEIEYRKTVPSCSHRRIGGNYGAFCKYWKLPLAETDGPDNCLEHLQGRTTSAMPLNTFSLTRQRKTSLSSTRGRDSSYDRALDEERRGSLPASIGSTDAMPLVSKFASKDIANKSSPSASRKSDKHDCADCSAGSSSTVNGSADVALPPPPSPSAGRPVGLYMKKGIKQAVQNIRRASSIGRLDKKKPTTATPVLSSQPQSAGTSPGLAVAALGGSSSQSASPKGVLSAQPASAHSATKADAPTDSGWSAVSLYSRLKRSMSLSKLTRKRGSSRLEEGGIVVANSSPTSSKLKTAMSCESLLAATAAGATSSSADIGEGNVQVHLVHPSVLGQDNCFQIVTETGGTTFYTCQNAEERDQWMACIRRAINPGGDKSHRTHISLKVCVQEAKNCLSKKKYFCEITMDKTLYARTSVKTKMDMLFWGEQFEFDNLPEVATISVTLYRDTEKKKRLDRNVNIGHVSIPVCCLANHQVTEKWYPLVVMSATSGGLGRSGSKPEPQPQIRIKTRYQKLHILPLAFYAELLHYVQTNYMHMVDNLEPLLSVRAKDDIAAVLVSIMLAEGKARDFLCDIVMADVLKQDNRHLMFRSNTIATKAVEAYMKIVGRKYLRTVLSDFVRTVLDSSDDCEVDPAKLHASGSGTLQRQQLNLLKYCEAAWSRISSSVTEFPRELQEVFTSLRTRSSEIGKGDVADNLISSCVFLRFLCPAIMSPSLFNLCQDFPDEKSARALTLVAKTVQSLANFSKFGGKEDYMLHMNDFVEREWSHMQAYLHQISTTDAKNRPDAAAAASDYPVVDLGKELSMLHALLGDELKIGASAGESACGTSTESVAATIQQSQPLDGLCLLLSRISNDLACPKSVLSVSVSTGSGSCSSPTGHPNTAAVAVATNANVIIGPGLEAASAAADVQAKTSQQSPSNDYVEFAWKQPPKPGSILAGSSSAWLVGTSGLESNAHVTNTNETRSTAKPVEIAEQPVAFTSPASVRAVDLSASTSLLENRQKENSVLHHPTGRNPVWQQHTLSGDYVDLVSLPSTSVHESYSSETTQEDDHLSTTSSCSRTATPSSGYASCNAGIVDESVRSGNRSSTPLACVPQKKELYGSREGSPVLSRPVQTTVPRIASSFTPPRQPTSSPLAFVNVGYQHRPSTGGPLSIRMPRKPGASSTDEQPPHSPSRTTSPSVVMQQSLPSQSRFLALPNRYGSLTVKSASKGSLTKPEPKVGARPVLQSQLQGEENVVASAARSDQQQAGQSARTIKVGKSIDGRAVSKLAQSFSNSCREQSPAVDATPAVRDEKRYGCAAFSVAELDSPAQPLRNAKTLIGRGAGSASSSRRPEQQQQLQPQEYRARAYSSSSADERVGAAFGGCDGSGGETPPSERSWSSSQGSFTSASARTLQRKLEEHQNVKQEHEGVVEELKTQLEEAQRRLEETEERLARQAEQTIIAMSEWQQRLDASEAKLNAQQREKDEQMQAILDRLRTVEEELRREQQEMKGSILQRQRMIELQERRIEQLDVANARLLGTLQQLKDKVSGGRTASGNVTSVDVGGGEHWASVTGKTESSVSGLTASSTVASPSTALGERLQPAQTVPAAAAPQQTTYKTILYYSHDSGKAGFV